MARFATPAATVLVTVGALLGVAVAPAVAHTDDVEVDDQRSADGSLTIEWEFVDSGGWLVVRGDDDGDPGAVLGHRRVDPETAFRTDTTVVIDESAWANVSESIDVWVVLHHDEGGDGFALEDDPMRTGRSGEPAGRRITVERADATTSVTAQDFGRQASNGTVTIRRVELAEPGYVAVHPVDAGSAGTVDDQDIGEAVGAVELSPGVHENVTVDLEDAYLRAAGPEALLAAVVHAGQDGFEAESTAPVTAGDALVATTFGVEFPGEAGEEPTPSPTTEESVLVTTPAPTATPTATRGRGAAPGALVAALALVGAGLLATGRAR